MLVSIIELNFTSGVPPGFPNRGTRLVIYRSLDLATISHKLGVFPDEGQTPPNQGF